MSFECQFDLAQNEALLQLVQAIECYKIGDFADSRALLTKIGVRDSLFQGIGLRDINVELSTTNAQVQIEAGSNVPLTYFDEFVQVLIQLKATEYRAKLFDSSSGGSQVWRSSDDDLDDVDLYDKQIFIMGETQEPLDEIIELLEEHDSTVQDEFDEDTQLIIVGDDGDINQAIAMNKHNVPIITETQFWQWLEEEPG